MDNKKLNLVFMGTPDFAVPTLKSLCEKYNVIAVYSQPPSKAGRGKKLKPSPVHTLAEEKGIPVFTPKSLKSEEEKQKFAALNSDIAVVAAYGLMLPEDILNAPEYGCLNVHASILPRWRGAAPIQRAIMAGDNKTGISIMKMDKGLDSGDVILTASTPINSDTTAGKLHDKLAEIGADIIVEAIEGYVSGMLQPQPQPLDGITYADKISKEEKRIDWEESADKISCKIRGLSPFPGAVFRYKDEDIKILNCEAVTKNFKASAIKNAAIGETLDDNLSVKCGTGVIKLTELQRPGKSPAYAEDFLRGYDIPSGSLLK